MPKFLVTLPCTDFHSFPFFVASTGSSVTFLPLLSFFLFSFCVFFLIIYFWLCWVFVSVRGLSLVAACGGLSLSRPLLLRSTGSRRAGSVVVAHGPSCSVACGLFPDQGLNPYPLHWQADSQPLRHQGSPQVFFFNCSKIHNIKFTVLSALPFSSAQVNGVKYIHVAVQPRPPSNSRALHLVKQKLYTH